MNKLKFSCYQLNTLAIDPDNDLFNSRINCCYVSELYDLDDSDSVMQISEILLKFASNSPETAQEFAKQAKDAEEITSRLPCQVQCLEFPDISEQFLKKQFD